MMRLSVISTLEELILTCIMKRLVWHMVSSSGREIQPDYPDSGLDIQPKIDEFRIVGF